MNKHVNDLRIDRAINCYYQVIGIDRSNNSRKNNISQARMALSNTLSMAGMHNDEIAKIVNRHRTSVCHHLKHHNGELKHWHGYKSKFDKCRMIVGVATESATAYEKVEILKTSQAQLKDEVDAIESQIENLENSI